MPEPLFICLQQSSESSGLENRAVVEVGDALLFDTRFQLRSPKTRHVDPFVHLQTCLVTPAIGRSYNLPQPPQIALNYLVGEFRAAHWVAPE